MGLIVFVAVIAACGSEAALPTCEDCGDAGATALDAGGDAPMMPDAPPPDDCVPAAETCDNTDEDCDGVVDEDLSQRCWNACNRGLEYCRAGAWVDCDAEPVPAETCNDMDDDCDLRIDEGIDRSMDEMNCGACGRVCEPGHGESWCQFGECVVLSCDAGWADCDGETANGCESHTVDYLTHPSADQHCGRCRNFCDSGAHCVAGVCRAVP